jgi:hypothetical protein
MNRDVIRDSAVQLGLTHQRGANGAFEGWRLSFQAITPQSSPTTAGE